MKPTLHRTISATRPGPVIVSSNTGLKLCYAAGHMLVLEKLPRPSAQAHVQHHSSTITALCAVPGMLASGDKSGQVALWDASKHHLRVAWQAGGGAAVVALQLLQLDCAGTNLEVLVILHAAPPDARAAAAAAVDLEPRRCPQEISQPSAGPQPLQTGTPCQQLSVWQLTCSGSPNSPSVSSAPASCTPGFGGFPEGQAEPALGSDAQATDAAIQSAQGCADASLAACPVLLTAVDLPALTEPAVQLSACVRRLKQQNSGMCGVPKGRTSCADQLASLLEGSLASVDATLSMQDVDAGNLGTSATCWEPTGYFLEVMVTSPTQVIFTQLELRHDTSHGSNQDSECSGQAGTKQGQSSALTVVRSNCYSPAMQTPAFRAQVAPFTASALVPGTGQACSATTSGHVLMWDFEEALTTRVRRESILGAGNPQFGSPAGLNMSAGLPSHVMLLKRQPTQLLRLHDDGAISCPAAAGRHLFVGGAEGTVRVFDERMRLVAWHKEALLAAGIAHIALAHSPSSLPGEEAEEAIAFTASNGSDAVGTGPTANSAAGSSSRSPSRATAAVAAAEQGAPPLDLIATSLDGTVVAVPGSCFHLVTLSPQPEGRTSRAASVIGRSSPDLTMALSRESIGASSQQRRQSLKLQATELVSSTQQRTSTCQLLSSAPTGARSAPAVASCFPTSSSVLLNPLPQRIVACLAHPQQMDKLLLLGEEGELQVRHLSSGSLVASSLLFPSLSAQQRSSSQHTCSPEAQPPTRQRPTGRLSALGNMPCQAAAGMCIGRARAASLPPRGSLEPTAAQQEAPASHVSCTAAALSRDGSFLAVGRSDGAIVMIDMAGSSEAPQRLRHAESAVCQLALAAGETLLAAANAAGEVLIYRQLASGTWGLSGRSQPGFSMGVLLLGEDPAGMTRIFTLDRGAVLTEFNLPSCSGTRSPILSLQVASSSNLPSLVESSSSSAAEPTAMCFAPPMPYYQRGSDATLLLIASSDCTLTIWDADARRVAARYSHASTIPRPLTALFTLRVGLTARLGPTVATAAAATLELLGGARTAQYAEVQLGMSRCPAGIRSRSTIDDSIAAAHTLLMPPPQHEQQQAAWVAFVACEGPEQQGVSLRSAFSSGTGSSSGGCDTRQGENGSDRCGIGSVGVLPWPLRKSSHIDQLDLQELQPAWEVRGVVAEGNMISHAAISGDAAWLALCTEPHAVPSSVVRSQAAPGCGCGVSIFGLQ